MPFEFWTALPFEYRTNGRHIPAVVAGGLAASHIPPIPPKRQHLTTSQTNTTNKNPPHHQNRFSRPKDQIWQYIDPYPEIFILLLQTIWIPNHNSQYSDPHSIYFYIAQLCIGNNACIPVLRTFIDDFIRQSELAISIAPLGCLLGVSALSLGADIKNPYTKNSIG